MSPEEDWVCVCGYRRALHGQAGVPACRKPVKSVGLTHGRLVPGSLATQRKPQRPPAPKGGKRK